MPSSKRPRTSRKPRHSRASAESMLGDVRREIQKRAAIKRPLTGDDAQEFLFRVRVAAFPQPK